MKRGSVEEVAKLAALGQGVLDVVRASKMLNKKPGRKRARVKKEKVHAE